MKKICIFQDTDRMENTKGLLEAARCLHGREAFETYAVLLEDPDTLSSTDFFGHFHHVVRVSDKIADSWDAGAMTEILEKLHQTHGFASILIPATNLGKMMAPRLARRLRTGLVSGVTEIKQRQDSLEIIRPAFSGKILEGIRVSGPEPLILSIRPNSFEYSPDAFPKRAFQTDISEYNGPVTVRSAARRIRVETHHLSRARDIRDYEVLIAGGSGVKDRFSDLYRLAETLGGTVAASRNLVDQGVAPRTIQVGQSGKTVSPRLYMALGIHGSIQHLAGLRQVDAIISVNTSNHAPICRLSDVVVQGDAGEFLDRLMEKILMYRSEDKGC